MNWFICYFLIVKWGVGFRKVKFEGGRKERVFKNLVDFLKFVIYLVSLESNSFWRMLNVIFFKFKM